MRSLYALRPSRRASMFAGLLYFLIESAQGIFLIPLFRSQSGAEAAAQWALMTSAMPLVNLAFAGYGSLLVIAISRTTGEAPSPLPNVSLALRRACIDSALVLLLAQALFAKFGVSPTSPRDMAALGAYFLAGQCRLSALNAYIALNGIRRVGLDKLLLLLTSSATAAVSVLAVIAGADVLLVAMTVLVFSAVQAMLAMGALGSLRAEGIQQDVEVPVIARRAAALVWLSQLGGFLNFGTEIPIAKSFLDTNGLADFAFASRAFQAPLAIVGLWCQISTPFWAAAPAVHGITATLRLLKKPLLVVLFGNIALLAVPSTWNMLFGAMTGWIFHTPPFFAWMLLNYGIAGMVIIIGSHMLATGQARHLLWVSLCGMTAPVAAWFSGRVIDRDYFYVGFTATTAVLLILHLVFVAAAHSKPASRTG